MAYPPGNKKNIYGTFRKMYDAAGTVSTRPKKLSEMTKAEKEERARAMNIEYGKTASNKPIKYNKKASGGIKTRGRGKSSASTPKGRRPGNTSNMELCSPNSKSKKCGPNAR